MNSPAPNATPQDARRPETLNLGGIVAILWESAVESFVRAILVFVFGSMAIGMASGIWGEMAPSRPPGLGHTMKAEAKSSPEWDAPEAWFAEHRFLIIFSLIFALTLWFRLVRRRPATEEAKGESYLGRIGKHLTENWFGLVVGNAFGALISAIVVVWVQQFTFANLLLNWLLESVLTILQGLAQHLLGTSSATTLHDWFAWYGDNQLKFTFWFFYLSAICDDLGIPNFKTLGCHVGRLLRRRLHIETSASGSLRRDA